MFSWMENTATEKHLPECGRQGGLIFDEMTIQQDLQMDRRDGSATLTGTVDMGKEGKALDSSKTNKNKSELATHALQMEFLGFTGFVFPFAHFPTVGAQAYHLCLLFWQAVRHLYDHSFYVHFCLFDGASSNRSFLKLMFHPHKPLEKNMTIDNLEVLNETIVLGMDVKHVIKRLRNNVFNSGTTAYSTRYLHWQGFPIIWDHWRCAFHWDVTSNPEMTRLHHKLSKEHIDLTSASKMRNHLAEHCLNDAMWFLMKSYSDSLEEKQQKELTGTLNFLSITSKLISFVNNNCTVLHVADDRFSVLENTISWFSKWEAEVLARTDIYSMAIKKSYLMSSETREDILFCCTSLREIMKKRIKSGYSVMPSRLNTVPRNMVLTTTPHTCNTRKV